MAFSPDTRTGFGRGLPTVDRYFSPKITPPSPWSKIELQPVPEHEEWEYKAGRESEERLAFLIATRPDVARVVIHPKFSIADMKSFDISVDFTPESKQVSVHLQDKTSRKGLAIWLTETPEWLEKHNLQMTPHESFVRRRLIPMVSGPSEPSDNILRRFDRRNREIQNRVRLERFRRPVTVFAA